jgi:hypothetical protein
MAIISVLVDTVEIATSLFAGDYSEQIRSIWLKVWDGVPPLPKDTEGDFKGILPKKGDDPKGQ